MNYYNSVEPSPSSLKFDKTNSTKLTRTTHTQTENLFTQQKLDVKRVVAEPEKV